MVQTACLLTFAAVSATTLAQVPTFVGCFSSSQPLVNQGKYKYQSSGYCNTVCQKEKKTVLGLSNGTTCWCGDELPSSANKVAKSKCNIPCQGYDLEDCGGSSGSTLYYTIWLTGLKADVPTFHGSSITSITKSASTSASHISSKTAFKTTSSHAAVGTSGAQSVQHSSKHQHGDEIVAIVLGAVFGVLALALLAFLLFWVYRRGKKSGHPAHRSTPLIASKRSSLEANGKKIPPANEKPLGDSSIPAVNVQGPTPTQSPERNPQMSDLAPAAAVAGWRKDSVPPRKPVPQRPSAQQANALTALPRLQSSNSSVYSKTSSDAGPFYTPLEEPPVVDFGESELHTLKGLVGVGEMNEGRSADLDLPIQGPKVGGGNEETVLYPTSSEARDFKFDGDGSRLQSALDAQHTFNASRGRVDGRDELP